ncbi:PqqD family protein [Bacillus cereus]|uniref:PqqD family protein n=1 Tax=Bacillus cereus TaxID=1396 RepID=A0A9X8IWC5_BACCE|nr:PqqD family protein [Bacillus cereus]RWQ71101.1 PqqD family protein [Bacillus cereus]
MIARKNPFVIQRHLNGKNYIRYEHAMFELDEIGLIIWESLDGTTDDKEIAQKIASKFSQDTTIIQQDVIEYLNDLKKEKLITF